MATHVCMKRMRREREQLEKSTSKEFCVCFKDEDLLNFTAYISGPEDSLYQHKFLKLAFEIPSNYPLVPPKVKFIQHSGGRIHPNLYTEGKVCLSILGTWPGERWATAMNVESVLITIRSLLDNKPYTHEPNQKDNPAYNDYVRYCTWQCLLLDHVQYEQAPKLQEFMQQYFRDNGSRMLSDLKQQSVKHASARSFRSAYSRQQVNVDYPALMKKVEGLIQAANSAAIKVTGTARDNNVDLTTVSDPNTSTSKGTSSYSAAEIEASQGLTKLPDSKSSKSQKPNNGSFDNTKHGMQSSGKASKRKLDEDNDESDLLDGLGSTSTSKKLKSEAPPKKEGVGCIIQ